MIRMITDTLITAYALLVMRGALGTVPFASAMTIVLGLWCGWQLRNSWKAQGLT